MNMNYIFDKKHLQNVNVSLFEMIKNMIKY